MVQRKLLSAVHQERRGTHRIYDTCEESPVDSKRLLPISNNISAASDADHHFLLLEIRIWFNVPWIYKVSHMVGSELRNCNIWSKPVLMPGFRLVIYAIFVVSGFPVVTNKSSHWYRMYPSPLPPSTSFRNVSSAIIAHILKSSTVSTKAIEGAEKVSYWVSTKVLLKLGCE